MENIASLKHRIVKKKQAPNTPTSMEGKCSIIIERLKPVEAEEGGAVGGLGPVISNSSFQVDDSK